MSLAAIVGGILGILIGSVPVWFVLNQTFNRKEKFKLVLVSVENV
jgi:hypothetical protein